MSVELITAMVARGGLVAAYGILPFLLRLVDLTQLLPYLRLLLVPQEALHARMDPLQLSIAMPGWRATKKKRGKETKQQFSIPSMGLPAHQDNIYSNKSFPLEFQ